MKVASLDLCKTLHELSGWDKTYLAYALANEGDYKPWLRVGIGSNSAYTEHPAYDLGYLLRRLGQTHEVRLYYQAGWGAGARSNLQIPPKQYRADTPENAATHLAIDLFKHDVLQREAA